MFRFDFFFLSIESVDLLRSSLLSFRNATNTYVTQYSKAGLMVGITER